jgi:hypothetical protein
MARLDDLRNTIALFNETYPRPQMPSLTLKPLYDLTLPHNARHAENLPLQWPGAPCPGVYIFLGTDIVEQRPGDDFVLYIGKASAGSTIGRRIGARYGYAEGYTHWQLKASDQRWTYIKYVTAVTVPPHRAFEAPAIEEYLIACLRPPLNSLGR